MSRYWHQIPPQACDYTGAISLLYGMPTLVLLLTPGGCVHPIIEVDEERNMNDVLVYKSTLNEIDMTLGMSDVLMQGLTELLEKHMDVEFITILGTPLTKLTGLDMDKLAKNIENDTHKTVVCVETNGFESYAVGYSNALKKLIARFSKEDKPWVDHRQYADVGILGYNPLLHGVVNHIDEIVSFFSCNGITSSCIQGKSLLSLIKNEFSTKVNIVISLEGIEVAKYLEKQYGIPYVLDIPVGNTGVYRLGNLLRSKRSQNVDNLEEAKKGNNESTTDKNVIVIGDPFMNEAVKKCLSYDFGIKNVNSYVVAPRSRGEMQLMDHLTNEIIFFENELELKEIINVADVVIADPLYKNLMTEEGTNCFIPLPYGAVSGKFFLKTHYKYIGRSGFEYFNSYLNQLREEK